jgi:hypothetical protein
MQRGEKFAGYSTLLSRPATLIAKLRPIQVLGHCHSAIALASSMWHRDGRIPDETCRSGTARPKPVTATHCPSSLLVPTVGVLAEFLHGRSGPDYVSRLHRRRERRVGHPISDLYRGRLLTTRQVAHRRQWTAGYAEGDASA